MSLRERIAPWGSLPQRAAQFQGSERLAVFWSLARSRLGKNRGEDKYFLGSLSFPVDSFATIVILKNAHKL
jgi:hypothetical protein